ncbi:MAG: hypothetical protein ACI4WX_01660 [Aristaeellaceae bacterium]
MGGLVQQQGLFAVSVLLMIAGMVASLGSAWFAYRFFDQNEKVSFALKLVGALISAFGFVLMFESFRL